MGAEGGEDTASVSTVGLITGGPSGELIAEIGRVREALERLQDKNDVLTAKVGGACVFARSFVSVRMYACLEGCGG